MRNLSISFLIDLLSYQHIYIYQDGSCLKAYVEENLAAAENFAQGVDVNAADKVRYILTL